MDKKIINSQNWKSVCAIFIQYSSFIKSRMIIWTKAHQEKFNLIFLWVKSSLFQISEFSAHIKDIESQQRTAEQYYWMIHVVFDLELPDVPGKKSTAKKEHNQLAGRRLTTFFSEISNIFDIFCGFIVDILGDLDGITAGSPYMASERIPAVMWNRRPKTKERMF